jgi:hypothetical protein
MRLHVFHIRSIDGIALEGKSDLARQSSLTDNGDVYGYEFEPHLN